MLFRSADVSAEAVIVPVADGLQASGGLLVVGEVYVKSDGGPKRGETLSAIRNDKELRASVSTVDYLDRKSTRLNSSHIPLSRMPSSA